MPRYGFRVTVFFAEPQIAMLGLGMALNAKFASNRIQAHCVPQFEVTNECEGDSNLRFSGHALTKPSIPASGEGFCQCQKCQRLRTNDSRFYILRQLALIIAMMPALTGSDRFVQLSTISSSSLSRSNKSTKLATKRSRCESQVVVISFFRTGPCRIPKLDVVGSNPIARF